VVLEEALEVGVRVWGASPHMLRVARRRRRTIGLGDDGYCRQPGSVQVLS
jgi:hypothetical protein